MTLAIPQHQAQLSQEENRPHGWTTLLPLLLVCFLLLLMVGCASSSVDQPVALMAKTESAVQSAIDAGAREFAPVELRRAEKNLSDSNAAVADENYKYAVYFAEKATADAELAEAKTRHAKAANQLEELENASSDLSDELN